MLAGQDTFIFYGTLSYEPKCCTNCGCKKEGNNIVKNGFGDSFKSSFIKDVRMSYISKIKKNNALNVESVILSFVLKHRCEKYCSISKNLIFT